MNSRDEELLRCAVELAAEARLAGNHPFGALLADTEGKILLTAQNTVVTGRDPTGHAETNLVRSASQQFGPAVLATCSVFTSTEPCAMCSGALYWGGFARIVYALEESKLAVLTGVDPTARTLVLGCQTVFAAGRNPPIVEGPALYDEAIAVHRGFWSDVE